MSPKRSSARRSWHQLFSSSDNGDPFPTPTSTTHPRIPPEEEIPLTSPSMIPQSQLPSNSTNLPHPPLSSESLAHETAAEEIGEAKHSQQPLAGAHDITNDSSTNVEEGSGSSTDEEEGSGSYTNDAIQREDEESFEADVSGFSLGSAPTDIVAVEEKKRTCRAVRKGGKPGAYVRVWSAQDEVRILEGLAIHVKTHGSPPGRSQLPDVLHGHIMDRKEFTISEIYEKVRRMRDKYRSMRATVASGAPLRGGADDLRKYEISNKIWGDLPPLPNGGNKKGNHAPGPRVRRDFEELQDIYPHLALVVEKIAADGQGPLKRAFELIDDAKARKLNAKVKKQRVLEIKAELDRASVRNEVLSMFIEFNKNR
ncbi:probable transcription factor At1g61730, partial [Triticum dicoccoides]|uniref:probable transcription factor At1g61730 n=1 Tax=Triticum dicoccoides TaxID=85692 RepID=UPI00188F853C